MTEEQEAYNKVIEYLKSLGYGMEMVAYDFVSPSYGHIDLVVKLSNQILIAIEIKLNSDIFKISPSEVSYHPVARQIQRLAIDVGSKYFFVTNGDSVLWLKTADNGRPQVIQPVNASDAINKKLSDLEFVEAIINNAVGFLKNYPVTGELSFDLSLVIYVKLRLDLGLKYDREVDYFIDRSKIEKSSSDKQSTLFKILDNWRGINFFNNKTEVFTIIDKYLEKDRFEWKIARWLADFMITLYPENEPKENILDLFSRYGVLISSAYGKGWKNVNGFYFNKSNEYWIKIQQILSSGKESLIEFAPNLLTDDFEANSKSNFDCVVLTPPFGLKTNDEKKDSVEILLSKALSKTKKGGYVISIVPDGFLLSNRYSKFRWSIIENANIKGIINLPKKAFTPTAFISTSIIIIQNGYNKSQGTFFASFNDLPDLDKNPITSILNNWEAFCKLKEFDFGKYGFLVEKLNPDNLHFSNYWIKGVQDEKEILQNAFQILPVKEVAKQIQRGKPYKKDKNEQIPFIAPAAVRPMNLLDEELSYTSKQLEPPNPIRVYENDIVINIIGSYRGSAALIDKNYNGYGLNHHLIVLRPNLNIVNPYYLAIALNSDYVQNQLKEVSRGGVIQALSLQSFESIYLPIPSMQIQEKICENYTTTLQEVYRKEKELNILRQKLNTIVSKIGKGDLL